MNFIWMYHFKLLQTQPVSDHVLVVEPVRYSQALKGLMVLFNVSQSPPRSLTCLTWMKYKIIMFDWVSWNEYWMKKLFELNDECIREGKWNFFLELLCYHYSDVIMSSMASRSTSDSIFTQPFVRAQIKEKKIVALCHWILWVEFTGHRWIPRIKSQ